MRRIATKLAVAVVLTAAAGVLLAACATGPTAQPGAGPSGRPSAGLTAAAPTLTRTFTPYDGHGHLTVPVAHRTRGHCWESSLAAPAANTFRCLAGNDILDPCFATPAGSAHPRTLACFTDPWSKATLLHLTHKLPKSQPLTARPWAAVLANGTRCVAATGTAPFVHGVGLGYDCGDGTWAALRAVGSKHVRAVTGREGGHTLTHTTVATLWRG